MTGVVPSLNCHPSLRLSHPTGGQARVTLRGGGGGGGRGGAMIFLVDLVHMNHPLDLTVLTASKQKWDSETTDFSTERIIDRSIACT